MAASVVTTLIFGFILYKIIERTFVVVWVHMPWWGGLIALGLLFLVIDYSVKRMFGVDRDG
jgi:hypothetical protein